MKFELRLVLPSAVQIQNIKGAQIISEKVSSASLCSLKVLLLQRTKLLWLTACFSEFSFVMH